MRIAALSLLTLGLTACGSHATPGPALPACGPGVDATVIPFSPTHVEGEAYGCGPGACDAGSQVLATSPTASLTLRLPGVFLTDVDALCVSAAGLDGSFTSGGTSLAPSLALVEIDSVGAEPGNPNIQTGFSQGKIDAVWFQANDGSWSEIRDVRFSGVFFPVP